MSANDAEFKFAVSRDKTKAKLEILVDGRSTGATIIQTPEIDGLINLLMKARSEMIEPVPGELDPNAVVRTIEDPGYTVGDNEAGDLFVTLRHPGAGWWTYRLSPDVAREFAGAIASYLEGRE